MLMTVPLYPLYRYLKMIPAVIGNILLFYLFPLIGNGRFSSGMSKLGYSKNHLIMAGRGYSPLELETYFL